MPLIVIDDREKNYSVLQESCEVRFERLEIGDFLIPDRIIVERKTSADLEASIIDGRLFQQLTKMKESYPLQLLAVIGKKFERLHENAIKGLISSVIFEYQIPILFFSNEIEFQNFIATTAKREQEGKKTIKLFYGKKPKNEMNGILTVVESLPGIGHETALNLLNHYKTLENFFKTTEKELLEVNGIGKQRAKRLEQLFKTSFIEE